MIFIDIHTHHLPAKPGGFFIKNIYPSDQVELLEPGGFYSVGLHPWHIANNNEHKAKLAELEQKASLPEVIAIGECGLDKLANTESQLQLSTFIEHSRVAEALNKPLIIHCVKCYNEISHLKRKMKPTVPWILHGFNGNDLIAKQLLALDFYFSLGRMIFNQEASVGQALSAIPPDRLFFETDEWNHPVEEVYRKYAELTGKPLDEVKEKILWNFRKVFIRE